MSCNIFNNTALKKKDEKYIVEYQKYEDFKKISNEDMDKLFKEIVNLKLNNKNFEIDFEYEFSENNPNHRIMRIFFENLLKEITEANENIEILKEMISINKKIAPQKEGNVNSN